MSERKPSPFKTLLDSDVCTLIEATEHVYQVRFKNRAANAYLVRGSSRTIMIDVGLSSNYPHLLTCLGHIGVKPGDIDMVVLSHEHLDHIGAAYHFHGKSYIAAHRLAANKIVIVTLGKGEFFGEMAVIDGSSRSATAIAAAPNTRVMRINHARFVYLVSQQPAFALMIMDALSKRLRASNTVAFRTAASS